MQVREIVPSAYGSPRAACAAAFAILSLLGGCGGGTDVSSSTTITNPNPVATPPAATPPASAPPAATVTLSWSAPAAVTYGTALSSAQLNATASAAGSFVYSPAAGTVLAAGTHTLNVSFTPSSGGSAISQSVPLSVNRAMPVVSWSAPAPIVAGTALSATQLNATSPIVGSFTYMPAVGAVLPAGSQTLQVSFMPTDTTDYTIATASVPLSVSAPPAIVQLSAATYTTTENAGWLSIEATRSGASATAISVSYSTADGSAAAGTAYGAVRGTLSWAAGDISSKLITIPILDQQRTSGSQSFTVTLSAPPSGTTLGTPANATVTIADNDAAPVDDCHPNAPGSDSTASYCTSPNFPTYGTAALPLPANPGAQIGDGLQLTGSATNLFSVVMGTTTPAANVVTGEVVRNIFYMNYIVGNLNETLGSPMDTGQSNNSTFAAVARHYEVGDPNDVHLMAEDGLHLRAICSQSHTDCSPGHVYAGMIRVPAELRPGMTIKVRYKSPAGMHSWAPIWMFSGSEYSPGPGGNPYLGYGTNSSLVREGSSGDLFEIDLNDNYPRWDNTPSVPTGEQVDYGTPNQYGVKWNVAPHPVYWAQGNGYSYQTGSAPAFEQLPFDWSAGFHDLVLSWESDNLLYLFVDGELVTASYMEYPASTYVDELAGGVTKTLAMHLILGNQAIASFTPGASSATENDGVADGWTIVIQEISVWNGNVSAPNSHQPAANGCDASCQQP